MTVALVQAALHLSIIVEAENAALRELDFAAAAQLLEQKRAAAQAIEAMRPADRLSVAAALGAAPAEHARAALTRLADALAENKRLLEHGIAVQREIVAIIARAVRPLLSESRGGYGAGAQPHVARPPPVAFAGRA